MTITLDGTNGITTPLDVEIQGSTSGSIILAAPAIAGSNTQTLVATTGTLAPIVSGTAVASTSGASIDFTGIPSWVKRITIMFAGVSTSGTSTPLVQLGDSGGIETTGYVSTSASMANAGATAASSSTAGYIIRSTQAANVISGQMVITLIGSNLWVSSHAFKQDTTTVMTGAGDKTLSDTLTQVRITTTGGTDTFDAGSINILYE
jgi:hypothetical protein